MLKYTGKLLFLGDGNEVADIEMSRDFWIMGHRKSVYMKSKDRRMSETNYWKKNGIKSGNIKSEKAYRIN